MWGFLVTIIAAYALGTDRTFLIDQPNYLDNFAQAPALEWLHALFQQGVQGAIVRVFTDELLWQAWAAALGSVLSPAVAVLVTVGALNLLVVLAVTRLKNPVLAVVVWLVVPVGFVVTGMLQLRQGFAFAVMLYVALSLNRPVLGTLIAAMIHTTFVLALPFSIVAWLCSHKRLLGLLTAITLAFIAAYLGGVLFQTFGGRRLQTYSVNETEANSILYVLGGLLCGLPSLQRLLAAPVPEESAVQDRTLANLAVMHVGVIAFTAASFFVFPLGAGRVGYLTMLLLIPILPTMSPRRSATRALLFSLLLLYLVYVAVKAYLEGTYDIYFAT